jgi:hypothetical protein
MMFAGEEYASYIALCRELRLALPWIWRSGDWYEFRGRVNLVPVTSEPAAYLAGLGVLPEATPLPRLDQWLAMLEEAGEDTVVLVKDDRWGRSAQTGKPGRPPWAPTYEEVVARLWMSVRRVAR